jgi:hypothetical protein
VNVTIGPKEERMLTTGRHAVCDIYCVGCQDNVGWHYVEAYEASEKYKEGKFIIENAKMVRTTLPKPE